MRFFKRKKDKISILKNKVVGVESQLRLGIESQKLMMGKLLAKSNKAVQSVSALDEVEFQVFSQFGDDGIIQWLVESLDVSKKIFVEFGVEDYRESNTRFLLMNNNWSGCVIDGDEENINLILGSEYCWKYELSVKAAFVTRENINELLTSFGLAGDIGLLHIDIDGNDYWVWEAIDVVAPDIVILEYNSVFGIERSISVPYSPVFQRTLSHHSNLYFGASLKALCDLSNSKGYAFIGSNSAGNNAYFVKKHKLNSKVRACSVSEGYRLSKFRESRDEKFKLTYVSGRDRLELIRGMDVVNTRTGEIEKL